jgi:hypothetical protein
MDLTNLILINKKFVRLSANSLITVLENEKKEYEERAKTIVKI